MPQLHGIASGSERYPLPASATLAPPTSDLDLVRGTSTNVLIVGDDEVVAGLLTSLWPSLSTPVVERHRGEPLRLSPTVPTMVVYDVDTITPHEQSELRDWIARNGRTQVVSTASRSLLPMVREGAFDEALYYRLNAVMVDPQSLAAR